jgi:hypothetical protein
MRQYGNVFAPSGLSAERALAATYPEIVTWPSLRVEVLSPSIGTNFKN